MKYCIITILILLSFAGFAQEQLVPMSINPTIRNNEILETLKPKSKTKGAEEAIKLPFIDDFSTRGLFPNQDLWADRNVFINSTYPVNQPSIGVATFDAMNDTGAVYPNMSIFASPADILTSKSIRMDSLFTSNSILSPSDSVYLSFYIQPQGIGDEPQLEDSIVLQFYDQVDSTWSSVWHMEGMKLDTFVNRYGSEFLQVLIPIKDPKYFGPDFRFRFFNYASIPSLTIPSWRSGVYDHWHLDYVYIDANRNMNDVFRDDDVAISEPVTSLLVKYESMPWNQFKANPTAEMDHSKEIKYKRLDDITGPINVAQFFSIQNLEDKSFFYPSSYPEAVNMTTGERYFKSNDNSYTFNSNADPYADFQVIYNMQSTPDMNRNNDSLKFFQRFYNYYAYDDGVPEAGYGLSTPNGQLAIQYTANVADSLQSIQFYFNQTLGWANQQYFNLVIWDDNGGIPGNIIYSQSGARPEFSSDLFKFQTYVLDQAVAISGVFYIGFQQTTQDNLNIGWDYNNNNQDKVFYNVTGIWYNSSFEGSPMIRPILGMEDNAYVGIPSKNEAELSIKLIIAPNPVTSNTLRLQLKGEESYKMQQGLLTIYNVNGQMVEQMQYTNSISINNLQSGIYFIQLISEDGTQRINKKFIVNKY